MELDKTLLNAIDEIKETLIKAGRLHLIDNLNELVKLAKSKQLVEETLDESYQALQPAGGILIENVTINIYDKDRMEINN